MVDVAAGEVNLRFIATMTLFVAGEDRADVQVR
jgi:hypothetical protein